MDKKLIHVNRLLYWWGAYIRAGMTCQGIYRTSEWPGKPEKGVKSAIPRSKFKKPLLPHCQPAESRTTRPTVPCLRFDAVSEDIHKIIVRMPEEWKPFILCLYIRGMRYSDISECLGIPSRKVGKIRHKVLYSVANKL